jgi:hypothetical protein
MSALPVSASTLPDDKSMKPASPASWQINKTHKPPFRACFSSPNLGHPFMTVAKGDIARWVPADASSAFWKCYSGKVPTDLLIQ